MRTTLQTEKEHPPVNFNRLPGPCSPRPLLYIYVIVYCRMNSKVPYLEKCESARKWCFGGAKSRHERAKVGDKEMNDFP